MATVARYPGSLNMFCRLSWCPRTGPGVAGCTSARGSPEHPRGMTGLAGNQLVCVIDYVPHGVVVEGHSQTITLPRLPERLTPRAHKHHGGGK